LQKRTSQGCVLEVIASTEIADPESHEDKKWTHEFVNQEAEESHVEEWYAWGVEWHDKEL